jgi:hypothetical protein
MKIFLVFYNFIIVIVNINVTKLRILRPRLNLSYLLSKLIKNSHILLVSPQNSEMDLTYPSNTAFNVFIIHIYIKLHGLSPLANYTDRVTAT